MPIYHSYVIPRDYGFAPNPFGRYCTLATCKPDIRGTAKIGDWVFGTSSIAGDTSSKLVFAMQVAEIISFDDYFSDMRFQYKKPVLNGSLKMMYGDNIYHTEHGVWQQADSHHSYENGETNQHNLARDTSSNNVLIATEFYYFGEKAFDIPEDLVLDFCKKGPGRRKVCEEIAIKMLEFIRQHAKEIDSGNPSGFLGEPSKFKFSFERYNGVS